MPDAAANIIPLDPNRRSRRTGRPRATTAATPPGQSLIRAFDDGWLLTLNSRGRSAGTIRSYRDTVQVFAAWLADNELPTDVEGVQPEHVRRFLIRERERTSAGNAHKHFRNLRAFFSWLVKQGDRSTPSPVDADDQPHVTEKELPRFTDDEVKALMATCKGSAFADLRDLAIIWLLIDVGPRVEGLAGIRYTDDPTTNDLELGKYRVRIRLKGGDEYLAPIGMRAAEVLSRYVRRARPRHPRATELEWLWLGKAGRFGKTGIQQMLRRRGEQAGVENVHPHRFRRTSASMFLDSGGSETDAMHVYGWKSPEMVRHYTKSTARERARRAHEQFAPGNRF